MKTCKHIVSYALVRVVLGLVTGCSGEPTARTDISAGAGVPGSTAAAGGAVSSSGGNEAAGATGSGGTSEGSLGGSKQTSPQGTGGRGGATGLGGGGSSETGGAGTGGKPTTGGTVAAGGSPSTGGASGKGGSPSAGGISGTGGSPSAGGISGTGGSPSAGGASGTGGSPSAGGVSGTGGSPSTGGLSGTGGSPSTGGLSGAGGSSTSAFDWGTTAYNASGDSSVAYQGHYTGQSCVSATCHKHKISFGGTVYQSNGTTTADSAQIGIRMGGTLTTTYGGKQGNFFGNLTGDTWSSAQIAVRTASGTQVMPSNDSASGNCNGCHTTSNRIVTQ
jgi:hypothetical protein